jgi:transposase
MKTVEVFLGADVSKGTIDLVGINAQREHCISPVVITNDVVSIKRYFNQLTKRFNAERMLVVFESTGVYSINLAMTLSELNIGYSQVSGLEIKLSKGISRGKSDRMDALQIAGFAVSNAFKLKRSHIPQKNVLELASLTTQRDKIVKALKAFKMNNEAIGHLPKDLVKQIERSNKSILNNLRKNLKLVERQMLEVIAKDPAMTANFQMLQSIPGIGQQAATKLIVLTENFTKFKNARKLACYVGVAPFPYQSGTSIKGRTKVHPIADKQFKGLLSLCALTAKRYDKELHGYFERKVSEGKNKMLIMNNIRNKLLARVFAVIDRQQPYVNLHKFAA